MPHINREPGGVDVTASAYIVRTDFDEPKIMLHRHKKLGHYLQFGGHKEATHDVWGTVAEEVREEAGFDFDQLAVLQPPHRITSLPNDTVIDLALLPTPVVHLRHKFEDANDPELTDHYHNDLGFALVVNEPPRHAPDDGESEDVVLLTAAEVEAYPDVPKNVRAICLFILRDAVPHWEPIPADQFTA